MAEEKKEKESVPLSKVDSSTIPNQDKNEQNDSKSSLENEHEKIRRRLQEWAADFFYACDIHADYHSSHKIMIQGVSSCAMDPFFQPLDWHEEWVEKTFSTDEWEQLMNMTKLVFPVTFRGKLTEFRRLLKENYMFTRDEHRVKYQMVACQLRRFVQLLTHSLLVMAKGQDIALEFVVNELEELIRTIELMYPGMDDDSLRFFEDRPIKKSPNLSKPGRD